MDDDKLEILIIEDDEDDYIILREMLNDIRGKDFEVEWLSNYQEASQVLARDCWDIILVDYDLGSGNGLDLIRRANEQGVKAPLIMVTGRGRYELDVEAMNNGAADYLTKNSINTPMLERVIRYNLEQSRSKEELETMNEELQATNEKLETLNREMGLRTVELNEVIAYLNSILASFSDSVIVINKDYLVEVWNPTAEELWGLRKEEVLGQSFFGLDIGLPVEQLKRSIRTVLMGENGKETFEITGTNRRGQTIQLQGSTTPLYNRDKKIAGVILILEPETPNPS